MSDLTDHIAAAHTFRWNRDSHPGMSLPECTCGAKVGSHDEHARHLAQVTEQEVLRKACEDYVNRAAETYWRDDSPFHLDARYFAQRAGEWLLARADENCQHQWVEEKGQEFCEVCHQSRADVETDGYAEAIVSAAEEAAQYIKWAR